MNLKITENQVDNLLKMVLSEERKKLISENWTRNGDANGYWKILYDTLKKGGIPVKLEIANDPAKSKYMYWGMWIIWKDLTKNGGYPITFTPPSKENFLFKFKDNGNKYVGQSSLDRISLDSECSGYYYPMNLSLFKKDQKDVTVTLYKDVIEKPDAINGFKCTFKTFKWLTDASNIKSEKTKKEAKSAWDTTLGPFLEKNKPPSTTYYKGRTQQSLTYKTGQGLQFRSDGTVHYPKGGVKDGDIIQYGTWKWDAKSGKPIVKNLNGQTLDIGQVMYNPYQQLVAGDAEAEKLAKQIFTDLKKAFDYDNDGDWTDYDRTNETLAMNAINKIKDKNVLEKLNAKIAAGGFKNIQNVEQWFKLEMSDWDPKEWDVIATRLNSLGYSVPKAGTIGKIYGYTVGGAINMVDKGITAAEDKFNYANKQTAVKKYTQPQALKILETQVNPDVDFLAEIILNASRWFGDDEVIVAKAFSRINNKQRYEKIKALLKQDPMTYVRTFLSKKEIERPVSDNLPSILASYNDIFNTDKLKIKKLEGVNPDSPEFAKILKNNLIFTPENPRGTKPDYVNTTPNTVSMNAIKMGPGSDKYIKGDTALVPKDFGWNLNTNTYPIPKPYPMEWINAYKKSVGRLNLETKFRRLTPRQQIIENIVESYKNKYSKKVINELNDGAATDRYVQSTTERIGKNAREKALEDALLKPIQDMQNWNSELARQKSLIPQRCSKPLEYTVRTSCTTDPLGMNQPAKFVTNNYEHTEKISMYSLCANYGGLWIKGATTASLTCTCRDMVSPLFGKIEVTNIRNEEAIQDCKTGGGKLYSYVNIGQEINSQQSSTDWTDPQSWIKATKEVVRWSTLIASIIFPAASPIINVIGGLAEFGLSAAEGNVADASVALFFTVLPGLKVLNIEQKVFESIGRKIITSNGAGMTAKEVEALYKMMDAEKLIADGIYKGVGREAQMISKLADTKITANMTRQEITAIMSARTTKAMTKEVAKAGTQAVGLQDAKIKLDDLTKKGLAFGQNLQQKATREV